MSCIEDSFGVSCSAPKAEHQEPNARCPVGWHSIRHLNICDTGLAASEAGPLSKCNSFAGAGVLLSKLIFVTQGLQLQKQVRSPNAICLLRQESFTPSSAELLLSAAAAEHLQWREALAESMLLGIEKPSVELQPTVSSVMGLGVRRVSCTFLGKRHFRGRGMPLVRACVQFCKALACWFYVCGPSLIMLLNSPATMTFSSIITFWLSRSDFSWFCAGNPTATPAQSPSCIRR